MSAPPSVADAPRRLVRPWPGWPGAATAALWIVTLAGGALLLARQADPTGASATPPAAFGRLLVEGLPAVDGRPATATDDHAEPPAGGAPARPPAPVPYLGLLPLVLAAAALVAAARVPRPGSLVGLGLAAGGSLAMLVPAPALDGARLPAAATALLGLAHLASTGLAGMLEDPARRPAPVAPAMAAAGLALAIAALLGATALWSGSASDAAALRPWRWLAEVDGSAHGGDLPEHLARLAADWRAALDRAAVTAFVSLVALLWFLKRRDAIATGALLLAVAADLGWAVTGAVAAG